MAKTHWSQKVKKSRPSMYRQTLGKPELRALGVEALYHDKERVEAQGKAGSAFHRAIINDLHSLGEGDYTPADEGMAPKGAE